MTQFTKPQHGADRALLSRAPKEWAPLPDDVGMFDKRLAHLTHAHRIEFSFAWRLAKKKDAVNV